MILFQIFEERDECDTVVFTAPDQMTQIAIMTGNRDEEALRRYVLEKAGYDPDQPCCPGEIGEQRGCNKKLYWVEEIKFRFIAH